MYITRPTHHVKRLTLIAMGQVTLIFGVKAYGRVADALPGSTPGRYPPGRRKGRVPRGHLLHFMVRVTHFIAPLRRLACACRLLLIRNPSSTQALFRQQTLLTPTLRLVGYC